MILLITTLALACITNAGPESDTPQLPISNYIPSITDEHKSDLAITFVIAAWLYLTVDEGNTHIQFFYPERVGNIIPAVRFLLSLIADAHNYVEEVRPTPQCRPPHPGGHPEPHLPPREALIRWLARYNLRSILEFIGVL